MVKIIPKENLNSLEKITETLQDPNKTPEMPFLVQLRSSSLDFWVAHFLWKCSFHQLIDTIAVY